MGNELQSQLSAQYYCTMRSPTVSIVRSSDEKDRLSHHSV